VGILSANKNFAIRQALRSSWINSRPADVVVKFLLDREDAATRIENWKHADSIYLNSSESGYAVKFGEVRDSQEAR
jgi:hypothetical protein